MGGFKLLVFIKKVFQFFILGNTSTFKKSGAKKEHGLAPPFPKVDKVDKKKTGLFKLL
jgi:hypothetical protein